MNRPSSNVPGIVSPRYLRSVTLFLALVVIMQFSDPLGDVSMSDATVFWIARLSSVALTLAAVEWLLGTFAVRYLTSPVWLKPAVLSMVIAALPMTVVETFLERNIPQAAPFDDAVVREASPLLAFVGEYLTILSVLLPINVLLWVAIDQRRKVAPLEAEHFAEPPFLNKVAGIKAGDVLALAAEEHYVKVITAEQTELVYARFSDAVDQMPDRLGLRVHRSWWVADLAVRNARRGDRRYRLVLVNGTEVPVSDKFLEATRSRGLIRR